MPKGFKGPRSSTSAIATRATSLTKEGSKQMQRDTQRLLKVDPEHKRFKPSYGVAFISMLPKRVQDDLYDKIILLERELKIRGLLTWFLFVPPETYHFTLEGVIERSSPDIEQDEVDHHFSVATKNKKTDIPTGGKSKIH